MVAPALLLAIVFVYAPFARSVGQSFAVVGADGRATGFAGLSNYARVLSEDIFWECLGNTFQFMALFCPLNMVLIFSAALLTEEKRGKARPLETVFMLPMAVGMSSAALAFKQMFRPGVGIVNRLIGVDIQWTNDAGAAMMSVVFLGIFLDFGLDYILLLGALRNMPRAPVEAAKLDGAGYWRLFWSIKLPLVSPTLLFVLFISVKDALLICAPVMVMTEGGPFRSTQTIVLQYYNEAFRNADYAAAAVIATLVFLLAGAVTILSWKADRRVHYEG